MTQDLDALPLPSFVKTSPERIYLVIGDNLEDGDEFNDLDEVTWCQDKLYDTDIEYVRADVAHTECYGVVKCKTLNGVELFPQQPGQPHTMTICEPRSPEDGHWYSPDAVREIVAAELRKAQDEISELRKAEAAWRKQCDTLTHQVICCGVAASHPDATLTTRGVYAGKWNSAQAEEVRKLRQERDALRKAQDGREPVWIVNDLGELGVKVGGRFFFLYKGGSIEYGAASEIEGGVCLHDDGSRMKYRIVGKREFGETCWPLKWVEAGRRQDRYTEQLVFTPGLSFGEPADGDWRDLPATSPPPKSDESSVERSLLRKIRQQDFLCDSLRAAIDAALAAQQAKKEAS